MHTLIVTFRLLYYFSKLIGVGSIFDAGNHNYRLSVPALLYSIVLTALITFGSLFQIRNGLSYVQFESGIVVKIGYHLVHLISSLHYIMVIFLSWLRSRELGIIATKMFYYNNLLVNPKIISNKEFSTFLLKILLVVAYFIYMIVRNLQTIMVEFYSFIYFIEYGFIIFTTYCILIQFTSFLNFYFLFFKIINRELKQIKIEYSNIHTSKSCFSKHIEQLCFAHYVKKQNPYGGSLKGKFNLQVQSATFSNVMFLLRRVMSDVTRRDILTYEQRGILNFQELVELHGRVCDEVNKVNAAYSVQ
ncbi:hypothetical protein L9F63_009268, partial [Diploptera punctata]